MTPLYERMQETLNWYVGTKLSDAGHKALLNALEDDVSSWLAEAATILGKENYE